MMKAVATRSSFRDACFCVFVLLILVCAATIPALAQSTASLTGIVTDASGAAVPNAKVTVTNKATGVSFNTQTDSAGAYLIRSEEHTSELQSHSDLVCRLLLEKKKINRRTK